MRVTGLSQGAAMRTDLALAGGRLSAIQRQLASGRRLERVSDGPAAGLEAMRYRRSLRGHAQYARNTGDAKSWLRTADSALNDVDDRLTRARELTIQSINGSLGAEARSAIAEELRGIADELVGLANADHLGRPIFSGTAATDVAYQVDGTYVGDLSAVNRRISPNATVQVIVAGPGVFGVQ
ncbi:MAG: flagellar hook-associated protein FlgL, partial [Acidimicrobiales bacterium]